MTPQGTLLLTRSQIAGMLVFDDYLEAIEAAFRSHGNGATLPQGLLHVDSPFGEFHIKAGGLNLDRMYFALKNNGGFRDNSRVGLPAIIGSITLSDATNGYPLAIMDSGEITRQRTAAAAAVAAKYLARTDSRVVTVCGCGVQGTMQLSAISRVLPITKAYAYDVDGEKCSRFTRELTERLSLEVEPAQNLCRAIQSSDVCITCTPSETFYVPANAVGEGTFVAAMGADSPGKQELDPRLVATSKLVVDIIGQCERAGELHHAIEAGLMTREGVYAELGEVVAGKKRGRTSKSEITIFDSTGTAMQDTAAAALAYRRALETGTGKVIDLMS